MPLLKATADLLSNTQLEKGIIEEIVDIDYLWALMPWVKVNGKAYVYNRENTLSEADFLSPNDIVNEGASDVTPVTVVLKIIAGDVDVDKFMIATESDTNDQLAIQLAQKSKGITRMFRRALINGDSSANPKSFDGLAKLTPASQTLVADANGAPVTLALLDELRDLVTNGADAFVMNRATWRAIKGLLRSYNGNTAEMMMVKDFGVPIPALDGLPVVLDDFISTTETVGTNHNTTSIYAARFNEADGVHAIYGGPNAGVQVESIGTVQNKDAVRWRVKWYCGMALKSTLSLARLTGITVG